MMVMTAILIIWDVFAVFDGGTESSISYVMVKWGKEFPALTFGCGFLAGHFFFPLRKYPWNKDETK